MMRYIILLFCYYIHVTQDYYFLVCEPEQEKSEPLIEVTEGDGYAEKQKVTYEDLVIHTQKYLDF